MCIPPYAGQKPLLLANTLRQHLKSNNNHCGCCLSNTYHVMALVHAFILISSTTLLSRITNVQILFCICTYEKTSCKFRIPSRVYLSPKCLCSFPLPLEDLEGLSFQSWAQNLFISGQIGSLASLKELRRQGHHCPISLTIAPNLRIPLNLTRVFLTESCLTLRMTRVQNLEGPLCSARSLSHELWPLAGGAFLSEHFSRTVAGVCLVKAIGCAPWQ